MSNPKRPNHPCPTCGEPAIQAVTREKAQAVGSFKCEAGHTWSSVSFETHFSSEIQALRGELQHLRARNQKLEESNAELCSDLLNAANTEAGLRAKISEMEKLLGWK